MNDSRIYDLVDFIKDYNTANHSIGLVCIENFLIAIFVGIFKESLAWGIGAFIVLGIIYAIPILGGVLSILCSFVETMIVYYILVQLSSPHASLFVSLFAFVFFVYLHRLYGNMSDDGMFGYSLLISECLFICLAIYVSIDSAPIALIVLIALIIVLFIPIMRAIEMIVLCLGTAFFFYLSIISFIEKKYAIIASIAVLLYVGANHIWAYSKLDYISMHQKIKEDKEKQQKTQNYVNSLIKFDNFKAQIYAQYPNLDELYYYFKMNVCQNEKERNYFDDDWKSYIYYLADHDFCSFNDYFEEKKLYKFRTYNREFASEWKQRLDKKETSK